MQMNETSSTMSVNLKMVCWRSEKFWLGKLVDHPEIMTQGETVEELEQNLRDAYRLMLLDDVPPDFQLRDVAL